MMTCFWCLIALISTLWLPKVESRSDYYHELSMQIFTPPTKIANESLFGYSITYVPKNKRLIVSAPNEPKFGNIYNCNLENHKCDLIQNYIKQERMQTSFGWSIAVDGQKIVMGDPAGKNGRVLYFSDIDNGKKGSLITKTVTELRYNLGYSVAAGHFLSDDATTFVFSTPYGLIGYGQILAHNGKNFVTYQQVKRVGMLFGASLCSARLESTRAALLVGAPAYATEHQYDVGAVYIYTFKEDRKKITMELRSTIYAKKDGGYFGYAIANLGDLNRDLKDEIAISAPYEDDGRGAVYIYSGLHLITKSPKELTWLQRIQPESFLAFGLSLSVINDYDENDCNELAVGAPFNNTAVMLRCIATIKIDVKDLKPYNETIKSTGSTGPLFKISSCVEIYRPKKLKHIEANVSVTITITHANCKLDNATDSSGMVTKYYIPRDILNNRSINKYCRNITIITPLELYYEPYVQYKVLIQQHNDPKNNSIFNATEVLLSDASVMSITSFFIVKECEGGKDCVPKLDLSKFISMPSPYTIGSSKNEEIEVILSNAGDAAYDACVIIDVKGVRIKEWGHSCLRQGVNEMLKCKPSVLLRTNTTWITDKIFLDVQSLNNNDKEIIINITLFDRCDGPVTKTNLKTIPLQADKDHVILKGSTSGGDIINLTRENIDVTGKRIQHVYSIYNNGSTTWVNLNMTISLEKQPYISRYTIPTGDFYHCTNLQETEEMYIMSCEVEILKSNRKIQVILPIELPPRILDKYLYKGAQVVSHLEVGLNEVKEPYSIRSSLHLYDASVPLWIIIAASLVGLLILIILAFVLHECGCLRRKNKEKLQALQRDVKRQSIRRSMVRVSTHSRDGTDHQPLITESDLENEVDTQDITLNIPPPTTELTVSEPIISEQEASNLKPELITSGVVINAEHMNNGAPTLITTGNVTKPKPTPAPKPKPTPEYKPETDYEVPLDLQKQNKLRADIILGGLQKNLLTQRNFSGSSTSLSNIK
ncbi:integrin alpha-4-like [Achroia grisella]|uniref:integrin alpha-4-like n=1 Tax=Achroia grisella TaxID=688607 RepID=UPI0027D2B253|nr:integrin alpha-4-like [Achroia grisella]